MQLFAVMVMDMIVPAVQQRQGCRDAPCTIKRVVQTQQGIAVDGTYFIVMSGYLTHGHFVTAVSRLVLIDIFKAQVDAGTGLRPSALHIPLGIERAE
jgi:hypothetical protein